MSLAGSVVAVMALWGLGAGSDGVAATLDDRRLDRYDRERVQQIVTDALGGEQHLTVDDGGGLNDVSGARIGAIRRTPSGEWITERQNDTAE